MSVGGRNKIVASLAALCGRQASGSDHVPTAYSSSVVLAPSTRRTIYCLPERIVTKFSYSVIS